MLQFDLAGVPLQVQALLAAMTTLTVSVAGCGDAASSAHSSAPGVSAGEAGNLSTTSTATTSGAGGATASIGVGGTTAALGATSGAAGNGGANPPAAPNVLVFSRTVGYRHSSIEAAIRALQGMARERGFSVSATEDPTAFSASGLANYDIVLFLSTTGDVLNAEQQAAFEQFIRSGRGFVGVHSASDTEYDWPWYGGLVGAYFRDHPDALQSATLLVEDSKHPATAQLPPRWTRTDEWYRFRENPRAQVQTLLRIDESTYDPGDASMGADHPIAWCHEYDGGRAFYTGLGHTDESYQEPAFLAHLWGGIQWAAGM